MADRLTQTQRHKNMQAVKSKDSRAEILLRKKLWAAGVRFRKNVKTLTGKPDIVLPKYKIAIFVDGDFWHGRGHKEHPGEQVKTNQAFWAAKIARNIERDSEVTDSLTEQGWLVLRFWEKDILKDADECLTKILQYL